MPLAFDYPVDIVERVTFRLPAGATIDAKEMRRKTPAFLFRFTPTRRQRTVTLEYSLHALRDAVRAAEVPNHLMAINDIEEEIACTIRPAAGTAQMGLIGSVGQSQRWKWTSVGGLILAAVVLAAFGAILANRSAGTAA